MKEDHFDYHKFDNLIIYEDNHLLVVNKPAGMLVQGDQTGDDSLIDNYKNYLKIKYSKPGNVFLGLVHRLDRPVSGIVVFTKTSKALSRMNELFKTKEVKKSYLALTREKPNQTSAILKNFLKKDSKKNKSFVYENERKGCKLASLKYTWLSSSDRYNLIYIDLYTGRHHQIRCQLSNAGFPIKGDLKYGYSRSNKSGGISLHAYMIRFVHPVKNKPLKLRAVVPDETVWNLFISTINGLKV